jgi:hypothetical protein
MIDQLKRMFLGQRIRVSHSGNKLGQLEGYCFSLNEGRAGEHDGEYALETEEGIILFVPEIVTSTSVEGELRAEFGGRRKIEVIPAEEKTLVLKCDIRTLIRNDDSNWLSNASALQLRAGDTVTFRGPYMMLYDHRAQVALQIVGESPETFIIESELENSPWFLEPEAE